MRGALEGRDHIRTTSEEDRAWEAAILRRVLSLHPTPLTLADLVRELGDEADFDLSDAVERGVRDLVACGLLHRSETLVLPSHAAVRFNELTGE